MTNKDELRALFAANLTYADVTRRDINVLKQILANEFSRANAGFGGYEGSVARSIALDRCTQLFDRNGGVRLAEMRCRASYFGMREAITFNEDGFIGFCGWSDSKNEKPILRAFEIWLKDYMLGDGVTFKRTLE